jgi:hypothetical protein
MVDTSRIENVNNHDLKVTTYARTVFAGRLRLCYIGHLPPERFLSCFPTKTLTNKPEK